MSHINMTITINLLLIGRPTTASRKSRSLHVILIKIMNNKKTVLKGNFTINY